MPVINKGTALSNGEQLTAEKLNDLLDLATFSPTATDGVSTFVNSSGQIAVLDGGIAANKLAANAVTTTKILNANVTTAKIADANVTFAKLADVIDDDTMATATDTTLATSESIKAYVDTSKTSAFTPSTYAGVESVTLPNGLIMKFGIHTTTSGTNVITFGTAFPSGCINVQYTRQKDTWSSFNENGCVLGTPNATSFDFYIDGTTFGNIYWTAIGY